MSEQWKDVIGYEGLYKVSDLGNIKSLSRKVKCKRWGVQTKKEMLLSLKPKKNGYVYVVLVDSNGQTKNLRVHRLVANGFISNPNNYPVVNHKNGIKSDNTLVNLEWCTHSENDIHKVAVLGKQTGANNSSSKLVLDTFTGIYYDTLKSACIAKDVDYKKASNILAGNRRGFTSFVYA